MLRVKLATDYSKSLTKDSQERSKIYQVVEAERRAKPDAKKATLNIIISYDNITNDLHDLIKDFSLGILSSFYIITKG